MKLRLPAGQWRDWLSVYALKYIAVGLAHTCRSAAAIAASVGTATGVPLAAEALLPRTKAPPEGVPPVPAWLCNFPVLHWL